jgi:hypothetical protein
MTAVILWKEYRHQRSFWLAVALLAVILVITLSSTMAQGSGMEVFEEDRVRDALIIVVVVLSISYGIVSGALLLAGESDDGTLVFLDSLSGWRGPLWVRKCLAGAILTLAMGLALAILAVGLGFAPWPVLVALPWLSLDALAWGLVGGALCRKVLPAVLVAILFLALSRLAFVIWGDWVILGTGTLASALAAVFASWRIYTRTDRDRRQHAGPPTATLIGGWDEVDVPLRARRPISVDRPATPVRRPSQRISIFRTVGVLIWLAVRQGRWLLAACLLGAVLLAFNVHREPLILWPLGTMVLGVLCGLAVFIFDQNEGARFLGAQRLPAGRIWTVKVLFWGAILLTLTALAWFVDAASGGVLFPSSQISQEVRGYRWFDALGNRAAIVAGPVFFGLWPLYGFCYGQFFGQLARRPILAVILAFSIAPAVVSIWVPSLLFGGLPTWQLLIPPVVLLVLTRLGQWPWMADRLLTFRPLAVITAGSTLTAVAVAACLWYRAAEVPDVGDPFDVPAFVASLPPPEENEAGRLIQRAGMELTEQRRLVDQQTPPPRGPLVPREGGRGQPGPVGPGGAPLPVGDLSEPSQPYGGWTWNTLLDQVLYYGWPQQDRELSRWLDEVFKGAWVKDAQAATQLPLGFMINPRLAEPKERWWNTIRDCRNLARYFVVRALQLQAHGDSGAALDHLKTALALSRQIRNAAPIAFLYAGDEMEATALVGLRAWLHKVGPDRDLLRAALKMLRDHQAAIPDPVNSIKAEYVIDRAELPTFARNADFLTELLANCYQVPWEKERQLRLGHAILSAGVAVQLQEMQQGPSANPLVRRASSPDEDKYSRWAMALNLPPAQGPGSRFSVQEWGELIEQFQLSRPHAYLPASVYWGSTVPSQTTLRATLLVTATAFYQAEHGKPPDALDALVSDDLPTLPLDPWTGQAFGYRVSLGEVIESEVPNIRLSPGQAVILTSRLGRGGYYPVPVWKK